MNPAIAILIVFIGCCSNVFFLELIIKFVLIDFYHYKTAILLHVIIFIVVNTGKIQELEI